MRLITGLVLLAVVLVVGATIGVLGRAWFDGRPSQGQTAARPAAPASVATVGPAAVAAAPTRAPAAPPPPPTAVPPRPAAALTATPASRDMVVEMSESDLQTQMNDMLVGHSLGSTPLGDAAIQSVTVALRNRRVNVGGAARAGFVNAPFTAVGTVAPDANGRALVTIDEATVGGMLLPEAARDALTDSLQTQVDGLFADRAMKVRTIDITDGKMRLVGTAGS